MRYAVVALVFVVGCSTGDNPVAPTPVTPPPVVVTPPVVTPPVTPTTPTAAFPPSEPWFDLAFYRKFVHTASDGTIQPLRRQGQAPRIYLRTVTDSGATIDTLTLEQTAAALIDTAGSMTGVFGLAGLERGTGNRLGQPGWITVEWLTSVTERVCGRGTVGGDSLRLYPNVAGCRCSGGPAVSLSTIRHELGHVLGFWHSDDPRDLMFPTLKECNTVPSEKEKRHAAVAYTRPIGSAAP